MIGKAKSQLSLLDSVFNRRKKRPRSEDLLTQIDNFVDWNRLVKEIEPVFKKSKRGRPSIPIIYSLKCLILQYLYNLSDPQLEDALIDRLSFQRFLGISFEEEIPDFTTIWRFRERLIKAKVLDKIFNYIVEMLEERELILKRGTIIDATIVQSARKPKKNKQKEEKTERSSQQDEDARFTKKGNKTYYGYKGHIGIDQGSHIIRKVTYTPSNVHDSKEFDRLMSGDEQSAFADKAYDSAERNSDLHLLSNIRILY
jgi:IS5 family transposase